MSKPLIVSNTIEIDAPASKVWDILTKPEQTKKYMFGCETVSDWKVGSELLWRGTFDGVELVAVKGHIKEIQPGKLLTYTTFDPNNPALKDVPENYLDVTYKLTEQNGKTTLDVSQGDFSTVEEGERRYTETYNNGDGWNPVLVHIKAIAEE